MNTYKVVTARGETEFVQADEAEIVEGQFRINLFRDPEILVASFVGYSSFNIVEEIPTPPETPEA